MIVLLLAVLFITGCASALETRYPDTCVVTQRDTQGPGYTTGTFPCTLKHVMVKDTLEP